MDILISFCNTIDTPNLLNLGLLNSDSMEFNVLKLPQEIPSTGMTGLVVSSKYLFVGLQQASIEKSDTSSPPALLIFDRINFQLIYSYIFHLVRDVHSFLLSKNEEKLFVVSSGTDELIEITLNDYKVVSETVYWRPELEGERSDNYHLNSVYEWQGDIYVSGFGKREEGQGWSSTQNGFIKNITKNEFVVAGLKHPHSINLLESSLIYCESRTRKLRFVDKELSLSLPGYTRGLCIVNGSIFIGTSAGRKKSKSTGKAVDLGSLQDAGCTIRRIDSVSLEVDAALDLSNYANEIYELIPISHTAMWPLHPPKNYRIQFEESWNEKIILSLAEIKGLIPEGETIIIVDENLWGLTEGSMTNYRCLPFLEREGLYWGSPESDEIAIQELERMKQLGSKFLAFGWPAFWWFNHYKEYSDYLESRYKRILDNERVILFDLR